jgi:flagellar FliJ protein
MTSIQPLISLLEQAERDRDAALAEHQMALRQHRNALAQAEQLRNYRNDHSRRWQQQFTQQGAIELVHCYQGFSDRLTQAVDFAQHGVDHAHERVAHCHTLLLQQEMRVASVRKLIERRQAEARMAQDRREQKASDEFAARLAWNQRVALGASGSL